MLRNLTVELVTQVKPCKHRLVHGRAVKAQHSQHDEPRETLKHRARQGS